VHCEWTCVLLLLLHACGFRGDRCAQEPTCAEEAQEQWWPSKRMRESSSVSSLRPCVPCAMRECWSQRRVSVTVGNGRMVGNSMRQQRREERRTAKRRERSVAMFPSVGHCARSAAHPPLTSPRPQAHPAAAAALTRAGGSDAPTPDSNGGWRTLPTRRGDGIFRPTLVPGVYARRRRTSPQWTVRSIGTRDRHHRPLA